MPYLSLDKPWWDADHMNEMTIGNEVIYGLVGDYSIDRTRCLSSMFYNKKLSGDFYGDPDAICNDVIDGKWTFDRLAQISAEVYSESDIVSMITAISTASSTEPERAPRPATRMIFR